MCSLSSHAEKADLGRRGFSTYSISSRWLSSQFSLPLLSLQSHCPFDCMTCWKPAALSLSLSGCLLAFRRLCSARRTQTMSRRRQFVRFSRRVRMRMRVGGGGVGGGEDGNRCHITSLSEAALRPGWLSLCATQWKAASSKLETTQERRSCAHGGSLVPLVCIYLLDDSCAFRRQRKPSPLRQTTRPA